MALLSQAQVSGGLLHERGEKEAAGWVQHQLIQAVHGSVLVKEPAGPSRF